MSSDAAQDGAKQPRSASTESSAHESARKHWRHAAQLGVQQLHKAQPWVDLDATPTERCIRLDYCSVSRTWTQSETVCKMESSQFAEGAMRRCFRLLKETQAPGVSEAWRHDWHHASAYVAKEYKDKAVGTREAYERDCRMQQDAKLWGERFDALKPPKAVDFLQAFLLELPDREGCPLFACERAIQGEYLKHNNNSGYVEPHRRATPQAFSHFTFQASGGRLIIVDIQGVGDLYTDPQVHSIEGGGYGEGNLGANGFALFFSAHRCSPLCARLGLTPFAKSPLEWVRGTVAAISVDGNHAAVGEDGQLNAEAVPSPGAAGLSIRSASSTSTTTDNSTVMQRTWSSLDAALNRGRQSSGTGLDSDDPHGLQAALAESRSALHVGLDTEQARNAARRTWAARESARWHAVVTRDNLPPWALESFNPPPAWLADMVPVPAAARLEAMQRTSDDLLAQGWSPATEASSKEQPVTPRSPKPAPVLSLPEEDAWRMFTPVHLALARYCACGALPVLDGVPDEPSATFHAFCAARGGDITAMRAVRDICRGVVQDMVPGARLEAEMPDLASALTQALARGGDPHACLEAAETAASPKEQLTWLERAMAAVDLASIAVDGQEADTAPPAAAADIQRYDLLERIASARLAAGDRSGAAASFAEASDAAAALGKGKLSMKLAEQAAALEDEE